jgi:hypothetical protein
MVHNIASTQAKGQEKYIAKDYEKILPEPQKK